MSPDAMLLTLFREAVDTASPDRRMSDHLPPAPAGRTVVIGAGKAAAAMARAFESAWTGPLEGMVVTRYGHGLACERIRVVEAAHPVSDQAGLDATSAIVDLVQGLTADDLVVCLLSGGGSALLAWPPPGVTLADKRRITEALLRSGATIGEINTVRKHVSRIKGGRLAALAAPARVHTLAISDVPGDDPSMIASGPTVQDTTTSAEARAILRRYGVPIPAAIEAWLADDRSEAPSAGPVETRLIATPTDSLAAAERLASQAGYAVWSLGADLEGEARRLGARHGALAAQIRAGQGPVAAPCIILSGGETTVTVRGRGRGGRNAEYLLGLAQALDGAAGVHALAADTDGLDGSEDNAGGLIGPDLLVRAARLGLSVSQALSDNDAYGFLAALNALVVTGPTRTNVNDFRAILIEALPENPSP